MKNLTECAELEKIPTSPLYIAIFSSHALNGAVSLTLIPIVWIRFCQRTAFHKNVKILVSVLFTYGVISNGFGLATYSFHMYHIIFPTNICSRIFYTTECSWSFYTLTGCILAFILVQASVTVERVIATCRLGTYEKGGHFLGPVMAAVVIVSSVLCLMWGMGEMDPKELQYQCGGIPLSTKKRMVAIYQIMLLVDIMSMTTFASTHYFNKKMLRSGKFELSLRYQAYENLKAIRIFLPVVTAHFTILGFFITGSIIVRQIRASLSPKAYGTTLLALYIIPYYTTIMCILFFVIMRKESAESKRFHTMVVERSHAKQESETYFRSLQEQWSNYVASL